MCTSTRECGEECKHYNECEERFGAFRLRRRVRLSVGALVVMAIARTLLCKCMLVWV